MDSTLQPALNARAPQATLPSSDPTSTMNNQPQNPIKFSSNPTSSTTSHVLAAPLQNVSPPQPLSTLNQSNDHASNYHALFNPAPAQTNNSHPSIGGPTATAPFLQDFSLVAEAAKRAQMSIVMRDLESVTL